MEQRTLLSRRRDVMRRRDMMRRRDNMRGHVRVRRLMLVLDGLMLHNMVLLHRLMLHWWMLHMRVQRVLLHVQRRVTASVVMVHVWLRLRLCRRCRCTNRRRRLGRGVRHHSRDRGRLGRRDDTVTGRLQHRRRQAVLRRGSHG